MLKFLRLMIMLTMMLRVKIQKSLLPLLVKLQIKLRLRLTKMYKLMIIKMMTKVRTISKIKIRMNPKKLKMLIRAKLLL